MKLFSVAIEKIIFIRSIPFFCLFFKSENSLNHIYDEYDMAIVGVFLVLQVQFYITTVHIQHTPCKI